MLTAAPPEPIRFADPSEHSVRFYDRDAQLLEEVADFLDAALRAGGLAVVIATADHRRELSRLLGGFGGPLGHNTTWFSGCVVLLDADETLAAFMVDGAPDPERFEATIGPILARGPAGRPLHAFGEMVAVLCEHGQYDAALALEGLWNELTSRYRFSLFCAYPQRLFTSPGTERAFRHICAAHTRVDAFTSDRQATSGQGLLEVRLQGLALQAEVERRRAAERTLRQRERELGEFLDNASEGIHKVAADGTILYANRAELDMLGYSWDEYVGRPITDFHVDSEVIRSILDRLQRGEVLRDQPALMRCRDGSHKPVLIYSNGYFEAGRLLYTRCFTRDATERVALEHATAERERLVESLREASRAKDEFLAMLGHELRNPLSPIVSALQLMRMRGDTGTAREQAIIQRQVEHMVRLVDDLLDISRITRGMVELKRERVDIPTVLAKAVEQASLLLEQRQHRLQMEVEPDLACHCDPVRLAQVVANLLTNAARYTEPGGQIVLRAWRASSQELAVSVRDDGKGIAPDMLERVFDLFFQGQRGIDRAGGGLGVGLALVRSLVELHGGTVQAFSEGPGRGSEFVVRLPWLDGAAEEPSAGRGSAAARPARPGRRVLLVDDNQDAAETLAHVMRLHGHEVTVFTDSVSVLQALPALRPEIAVLDIGLPVMDGYELGARIREAGIRCPLVALTGYGQEADRQRSEAAGFRHHLVKPIAPEQLLAILDTPSVEARA